MKYGEKKSNFAEYGIYLLKRRIYSLIRTLNIRGNHWENYISDLVKDINETPVKSIGHIRPGDINSSYDNVKIDNFLAKKPEIPYRTLMKNQKKYESNSKLIQIGAYVYANLKTSAAFDKSYDFKVSTILNLILSMKSKIIIVSYPFSGGGGVEWMPVCL